jgi:lipopolysaccharide export system protein LptA
LIASTPALAGAREADTKHAKKLASLSLLPPGSELNKVILPRYDENLRLTGVLKAEAMTLVDEQTISGRSVIIEFFNPDRSPRGRIDLDQATVHQASGTLEARDSVVLRSERLNAEGNGLIYQFEKGEGFLLGPVTMWIQSPPTTAMNPSSLRPLAAGVAAAAMLPQSLAAAPPPSITTDQRAAIAADAAPAAPAHAAGALKLGAGLLDDLDASAEATLKVREFIRQSQGAGDAADVPEGGRQAPKQLDIKPGPDDTVITCDGGMYFNPDEGVFVFLRNVRVTDPRLTLTGADELKIFLAKKSADAAADPGGSEPENSGGIPFAAKLGEVERVVATGNLHMIQRKTADTDEPAEASGSVLTYNIKSGNATLSGGNLWGKRGRIAFVAREPNLTLLVEKSGRLVTEGKWETIVLTEKK